MDDLPLPDLDDPPPPPPAAGAYRVQVGAIRDPVGSAPALARILGVDLPTAQRIAVNAPGVLVAGLARIAAERVARDVEALGIRARVEEEGAPSRPLSGRPEAPSSVRPGAPSSRPPAALAAAPAASGSGPGDGFWLQAPVAFVAPLLGKGSLLLAAAGFTGLGAAVIAAAPGLFIKIGIVLALQLVALGIFIEVFNRLAQAAIYRDDDAWLPEPISELPDMKTLFWRGVVNLVVLALLGTPAVLVALKLDNAAVAIGIQIALFVYWPMALTVQSISGRLTGALDFLSVGRGIVAAPLEYLTACVLTFAAIAGSTALVLAIAGASVMAVASAGGGFGSGFAVYCVVSFAWFTAIAYFHGVLGYLMGALVRSKRAAFEFLTEG